MIILLVRLEMRLEILDTFGKYRDLDFRRTGISFMSGELFHERLLILVFHMEYFVKK